jgi:hypothetical protein
MAKHRSAKSGKSKGYAGFGSERGTRSNYAKNRNENKDTTGLKAVCVWCLCYRISGDVASLAVKDAAGHSKTAAVPLQNSMRYRTLCYTPHPVTPLATQQFRYPST